MHSRPLPKFSIFSNKVKLFSNLATGSKGQPSQLQSLYSSSSKIHNNQAICVYWAWGEQWNQLFACILWFRGDQDVFERQYQVRNKRFHGGKKLTCWVLFHSFHYLLSFFQQHCEITAFCWWINRFGKEKQLS